MPNNYEHPAWAIYDELVTIKLNVYYVEWEQLVFRRSLLFSELFLALSASSAVASFWIWKTTALGGLIWQSIAMLAAITAVTKPILNLSEKIVVTTELLTDARNIEHELNTLVQLIRQSDDYDSHHKERFMKAMEYKGNFIKNYKNGKSNRRKVDELYNRVLKEMPPERFHIPGEQP